MYRRHILTLLLALAVLTPSALAQTRTRYTEYINQYMQMAIDQMARYKIPASITLSQGLLESGAGYSRLAREGNNHFGIKCGSSWTGPYIIATDDAPNEHFRAYSSAAESYEDHSRFLRTNRRYASLFDRKITDYKGWARGLKAAGYATNPRYADNLIQIIESYDLNKLDYAVSRSPKRIDRMTQRVSTDHRVYACNKNFYTIARQGDTFKSLAKEMGVSARKLRKYNEVPKDIELHDGDVVYMEKKQKQADARWKGVWHTIEPGESMHSIAQHYGMQLKTLYKLHYRPYSFVPRAGDVLLIRK